MNAASRRRVIVHTPVALRRMVCTGIRSLEYLINEHIAHVKKKIIIKSHTKETSCWHARSQRRRHTDVNYI